MKCFICDRTLEEDQVHYNVDHQDYDPCPTCLNVIEDLVAGYSGQPDPEDDSDILPFIEELYPLVYDPIKDEENP